MKFLKENSPWCSGALARSSLAFVPTSKKSEERSAVLLQISIEGFGLLGGNRLEMFEKFIV